MFKFTVSSLLIASALFGSSAFAEEERVMKLKPGNWLWSHTTLLVVFEDSESDYQCIPEEMSSMSLQQVIDTIIDTGDADCTVSNISSNGAENVLDFDLACEGVYSGRAKGKFTHASEENISIEATGTVSALGAQGPFSFSANAQHQGVCTSNS